MTCWLPWPAAYRGGSRGGFRPPPRGNLTLLLRRCLDRLLERRVAGRADLVHAVVGEGRVAVLVERVRAQNGVGVLGVEQSLQDGGLVVALVAEALDRVEAELHGLIAVDRVRIRMRVVVLGLVGLQELLAAGIGRQVQRGDGALEPRA